MTPEPTEADLAKARDVYWSCSKPGGGLSELSIMHIAQALSTARAEGEAERERLREKAIVGGYMWTPAELQEAIEAEREACAEIADFGVKWSPELSAQKWVDESCTRVAAAIRARSHQP